MTHTFKLARRMSRLRTFPLAAGLLVAGACNSADLLQSNSAGDAAKPSLLTASTAVTVSNISVSTGEAYQAVTSLAAGNTMYIDRSYTYSTIPSSMAGATYIRTANDDKAAYAGSSSFLGFDLGADATVYVGFDDRVSRPSWLSSNFTDTGLDIVGSDGTKYSLLKRSYAKGRVTLGSNLAASTSATSYSMYIVLVLPSSTTTTATTTTTTTTTTGAGIPFGTFGLPTSSYSNTQTWTGALKYLSPSSSALTELATAKQYHARVVIPFAGSSSTFKNSDGTFNMTKWKANVDKWRTINIGPYITDGTLLANYLVDEPSWSGSWGGKVISQADLETMAAYSKSIWPGLATTVRTTAAYLIGYNVPHIDFAWAQWEGPLHQPSYNMTPEQFRDKMIAQAQQAGVKLMFGMNFLDGGNGSSGIPGTYNLSTVKTRWQMSAAEVAQVGKVFAAASYACGVMNWRWSMDYPWTSYFTTSQYNAIKNFDSRSDVQSALAQVASVAKNRTTTSCKR